ncbi:MAG: undecaprenyl-diphosphate phosphatase [Bdellovibrionales bacterium]|nr:undecaprenyl-diphosphate phosphatase [Bdellovibrionales bacterium]
MTIFESLILGVVEGLTEYLPVSSTGHLILASQVLKLEDNEATKAFEIVIQSGAILAVVWLYRAKLISMIQGAFRGQAEAVRQILALFLAFLPAAVIGLALHKKIKEHLFGTGPVVGALIVGGVAMIAIERYLRRRPTQFRFMASASPSAGTAVKIGFFQCFAMWPGTSRSMATILGGRLCGLNASQAAEFSFLLAIPTLMAATAFDLFKHGHEITSAIGPAQLVVGLLASFIVALVVVRFFLEFLRSYSLEVFGWYRILAGVLVWFLSR